MQSSSVTDSWSGSTTSLDGWCNHSHCPFSPLITASYLLYTYPIGSLPSLCHQVKSLSLSLLFFYNRFSSIIKPASLLLGLPSTSCRCFRSKSFSRLKKATRATLASSKPWNCHDCCEFLGSLQYWITSKVCHAAHNLLETWYFSALTCVSCSFS